MNNPQKPKSVFYSLTKFKEYKSLFLTFLFIVVIPLLIIKSVITHEFYLNFAPYTISAVIYLIMFLFINSFIVLHGLARGKKLSFLQVLKYIPSIIPFIILPILVFTILFIFLNKIFFIASFLLLAYVPIISFAPLFNKKISFTEIIDANKTFQQSETGKKLLKNTIVLSIILGIIIFIFKNFFVGFFSFTNNTLVYSLSVVIIDLLYAVVFFILYLTIVDTYSGYSFILPDKLYKVGKEVISETKNTREKRRDFPSKKHPRRKKNIFDFEKEEKEIAYKESSSKERNRFLEDSGYNRFENTKF